MKFAHRVQAVTKCKVLGVILLMACSHDPLSGPLSFEGTGSTSMLSSRELDAYRADRSYIQKLAPIGESVYINYTDPRQYSFILARLKMTGKTPENSPQLFEEIEQLKKAQTAQKFGAGSMIASPATNAWQSLHLIGPLGNTNGGPNNVGGSAIASRKDKLNYGYVDTTVWDGLGNQIGDVVYYETYGDMPNRQVVASGSRTYAQDNQIQTDSMMMEVILATGEMRTSYIVGPTIALDPIIPSLQARSAQPGPLNAVADIPVVIHPKQAAGVTLPIKICLERQGADCTYYNGFSEVGQNLTWKVRLPLKGSIKISPGSTHKFDAAKLAQLQAGTATTMTMILLGYEQAGGGCMNAGGIMTKEVTAQDFWKSVTLTPDPDVMNNNADRILTWDMSAPANWAKFSESCQLLDTPTYLSMYIAFPLKNGNFTSLLHAWISNKSGYVCMTAPSAVCLAYTPNMTVVNSCLAEGTRVAIDGATSRKIEDLRLGEKVSNPYATNLTIIDTISGTELTPMVRIADDKDHDLLLTEMHPIYVEGRGMVPAKLLKVGDLMRTDVGPSRLIRVTREDFRGKVYNLKLGSHDEAMKLGVDQTAMYANGFLVGDAQIQDRYQTMETAQLYPAKPDGKLSPRWRKDYQQSLNRAANSTARAR